MATGGMMFFTAAFAAVTAILASAAHDENRTAEAQQGYRSLAEAGPPCDQSAAVVPLSGQFQERKIDQPPGTAWEFMPDTGCSFRLWESQQVSECLQGTWLVIVGASQTNIWTTQLANTLAPGALLSKRDNFSIDGVFTLLIDLVIEDGKVVYKQIITDPRAVRNERVGARNFDRDRKVLSKAFAKTAQVTYSPRAIRITNYLAEWWDNADLAIKAVENAKDEWASAKVTLVAAIGLWYANTFGCSLQKAWCATRPAYLNFTLDALMAQYRVDMARSLPVLQRFCSKAGRAKDLGCALMTIAHCEWMQAEVWHRTYEVAKDVLQTLATPLLRFVDLWTLTRQMPELCVGGHQSPMSVHWTWQVLLGGLCKTTRAAEGGLAAFSGTLCRAADVEVKCADPTTSGYQYKWECALSELCTMTAAGPPLGQPPTGDPSAQRGNTAFMSAVEMVRQREFRPFELARFKSVYGANWLLLVLAMAFVVLIGAALYRAVVGDQEHSLASPQVGCELLGLAAEPL